MKSYTVIYRFNGKTQKQFVKATDKTQAMYRFWEELPNCQNKALTYHILDIKEN